MDNSVPYVDDGRRHRICHADVVREPSNQSLPWPDFITAVVKSWL